MIDADEMVKKAIAAYKAGKKSQARDLLTKVVDVDERNEQGWLYLSLVVDSLEEQELCLENVLSINPANTQARKAIDVVRKKQGKPPLGDAPSSLGKMPSSAPIAPPSPPPAVDPWGNVDAAWGDLAAGKGRGSSSWGDPLDSDPNPWGAPSTPPPPAAPPPPPPATSKSSSASSPWDSGMWEAPPKPPANADKAPWGGGETDTGWFSDAPATSVEWGRDSGTGGATAGGYHGSGQNVAGPSSNELDSWIDGLNLGKGGAAEPSTTSPAKSAGPQKTEDPLAGLDWSAGWEQMGGGGVFGNIEQTSPFKIDDLGAGAVAKPETYLKPEPKKPEPSKPAPAASRPAPPPAPSRSRYADDDDDDDDDGGYGQLRFGDEAKSDDSFFKAGFLEDEEDEYAPYFALIPEEIQAPSSNKTKAKQKSSGGSPVVVILLGLLNLAALAGLVFNLMS